MTADISQIIQATFRSSLGQFRLDASFSIPATGVTALFGPSGCGKTTVLRCIAGLQHLPDSYCAIDGDIWQDRTSFRPPHKRPVGYVFQEASLFPHLTVNQNLLFGTPRAAPTSEEKAVDFDEVINLLGLVRLLDRLPQKLSGGERQRVAIGRALLSRPKILLMDEPLTALDHTTKSEILPYLERLHEQLSLPVIYVSHDIAEIERLADHLILMEAGRVVASGPLAELQSDPTLPLIKDRDAAISLDAIVEGYDSEYGLLTLAVADAKLILPAPRAQSGDRRRIRIVAGDVSLALEPPSFSTILNSLPAQILTGTAVGNHEVVVLLALGADGKGARILARVARRSWDQLGLSGGRSVHALVKSVSLARSSQDPDTEILNNAAVSLQ